VAHFNERGCDHPSSEFGTREMSPQNHSRFFPLDRRSAEHPEHIDPLIESCRRQRVSRSFFFSIALIHGPCPLLRDFLAALGLPPGVVISRRTLIRSVLFLSCLGIFAAHRRMSPWGDVSLPPVRREEQTFFFVGGPLVCDFFPPPKFCPLISPLGLPLTLFQASLS